MDKTGHISKKNTVIALAIIAAFAVLGTVFVKCSTGEAPDGFDPTRIDTQETE